MQRPSFQFYPDAWLSNANLKRCTKAEKGTWIDVMCLLHDGDQYGILQWPLTDLARASDSEIKILKSLQVKGILKGADVGQTCPEYVYVPRSGRKNGTPVILIPQQLGPIWFSSRMVVDEYKRKIRESNLPRDNQFESPMRGNGASPMRGNGPHPSIHLSEDEDGDEEESYRVVS